MKTQHLTEASTAAILAALHRIGQQHFKLAEEGRNLPDRSYHVGVTLAMEAARQIVRRAVERGPDAVGGVLLREGILDVEPAGGDQ